MTRITRKEFLGMSAAAVTSAVLGKSTPVNAMQTSAAASDASRPTIIRGADLLTMDPTLKEVPGADVLIENGRISSIGNDLSAEGAEIIDANGMILMPGHGGGAVFHEHHGDIMPVENRIDDAGKACMEKR